ncbi:MAG: HAD family hydrolase [Planctomycetales bacterium]|nr:HAD family hydrolase [Planctomycetales bacterium]
MSDNIEQDYRRVVDTSVGTSFLPGTSIEIVRGLQAKRVPRQVLFDFDGTLSLVREGWPEIMVPMMVEFLTETGTSESQDELYKLSHDFVMELNGKQTIYQMFRLVEEIEKRGGTARPALEYKEIYHQRLMDRIESRRDDLRTGRVEPTEMLVPGTMELLTNLMARGAVLYLASGTDENYVKEEVELLQLSLFFGEHVHGAVDDYKSFSKAQVIQRILETNNVDGAELLGFGDGYVEIQNIKAVGGTAVAVASDESGRSGKPDEWKRNRLIGVGADLVIPDYAECDRLLAYLFEG